MIDAVFIAIGFVSVTSLRYVRNDTEGAFLESYYGVTQRSLLDTGIHGWWEGIRADTPLKPLEREALPPLDSPWNGLFSG